MAHTTAEAPGSATENMYNHDGGFPLRVIVQQLQEEAKHFSVLTGLNSSFWIQETTSNSQAFPLNLNDTYF